MKKAKRVSDIGAVGPPPPVPPSYMPEVQFANIPQPNNYNGNMAPNYGYNQQAPNPGFVSYPGQPNYGQPMSSPGQFQPPNHQPMSSPMPGAPNVNIPGQFAMFQQPIVQDMAMQYGQQLASTGKAMVNREIEKYVPVSRLKYYFAVDTSYVVSKLKLLLFPFTHKDWSVKYEQEAPVQPRYDINAPDLYIPTMAYITYVFLAGLILGMQNRFSPEQIGIQASSALAYHIFEIFVYSATLYITNIQTSLRTLDLLAYSGYKYTAIIWCLLTSFAFKRTGYYLALIYTSLSLAFFLVRTLKVLVLQIPSNATDFSGQQMAYGANYNSASDAGGTKRRLYFLLFVALTQPFLVWWLSFHLLPLNVVEHHPSDL